MKGRNLAGTVSFDATVPDAGGVVLDLRWPQDDLAAGPGAAAGGSAPESGTAGSASAKVPPGRLVPRRP
jgi:hypothetical protein